MENPKFQIKPSANNQYYFVLRAKNGEIILTASETYKTKQSCTGAIESVKVNAPVAERYTKTENYGKYTFNLKAANGEILGKSESYTTSSARDSGIEAVKRDAPAAPTEDLA